MWSNYTALPKFATSKTAVWWDINDCPVPDGCDSGRVRPSIEGALKNLGYNGPVTITAYGDLKQTPDHVLRRLSSTGVSVQHTVKELRCSFMYSDLLEWQEHNPPPATVMLISDQVEDVFSFALCREHQMKHGYNVVLAFTHISYKASVLYTTARWLWGSLLTQVLRKCGGETGESAMLHCRSCDFDTKSHEIFTNHLSGEEHAQKETRLNRSTHPSLGPVPVPEYEQSKIKRMPRNNAASPEFATSKTAVWWDMMDCPVPDGYDARRVRPSIEGVLKNLGYSGPASITAYGDLTQTPDHVLRGLSSTGVAVQHTFKGRKSCSLMYSDLLAWHHDNPPPATIMLISDHVELAFSHVLCRLKQLRPGYNLVLAYTSTATRASVLVTSAEWLWESLLTDSESPRQVLHKCSETGESSLLRCRSCRFDGQSLEDFTKHLSSDEHAQEEIRMNESIGPSAEYEQSKVENSPKSKRLRKAFRNRFSRFGNYLSLSNRVSRRRTSREVIGPGSSAAHESPKPARKRSKIVLHK